MTLPGIRGTPVVLEFLAAIAVSLAVGAAYGHQTGYKAGWKNGAAYGGKVHMSGDDIERLVQGR